MPTISIIMGIYNGAEKIESAINSLLGQTYEDFEILICDDGSTDNSYEVITRLSEIDHRIKVLKNAKNLGLSSTLNKCIEHSQGEYIARMDDDDISYPKRLETQLSFLEKNKEFALVGTSRNLFDKEGIWGTHIVKGERKKNEIFLGKTFIHPSVMIRKDALIDVGCYSESSSIGRTEDYDLWCKLYSRGYKGYNLDDILINYYEARDSYTKRKFKYRICEYRLKKKWYKELGIHKKYYIYMYRPLIVGLIPPKLLMLHHKRVFRNNEL